MIITVVVGCILGINSFLDFGVSLKLIDDVKLQLEINGKKELNFLIVII